MTNHKKYMRRCLEIAGLGAGQVAPNPMVGCVIVHNDRIIGEGYHAQYGGPHAEVNAIRSVKRRELLTESTLYVNLEPCAHHGKTPPCADLIVEQKIPRVIIGTSDPFSEVSGKGIEILQRGGVQVEVEILNEDCRWLNRRFFTFHEKKRPYIILKWAQTLDGYIDLIRDAGQSAQPNWISNSLARTLVHKTRTEEASILVGTNTVLKDNPSLTARDWAGQSPVRLVIDRENRLPKHLNVFDGSVRTLIFTHLQVNQLTGPECCRIDFEREVPGQILKELYERRILSVIIEGGAFTLQQFIDTGLWDEAHIYSGSKMFFGGIKAPIIQGVPYACENLDDSYLTVLVNKNPVR
jgi:diaminohydroxyphosphoribosylaminopyrimidine deaminase / 5-amino-6-(5-phosphoribosylamino)uracil reductase